MSDILLFLATYCAFLFAPDSFRFVNSIVVEQFGDAAVELESKSVRLRFRRERGQLLVTFQPMSPQSDEWFSPGPLRGVLLGDRGGSEVLSPEWADFLHWALPELQARFSDPQRAAETIHALHEQERQRMQQMFE